MPSSHARMSLGQETQEDDVGRGMPSSPWTTYKVRRRLMWHVIIALGQNTRSDGVERGMQSYTLDCTYGRKTLILSCYHLLWTSHTVGRCKAWHVRMSLGKQTRSDDAGQGMPSSPLDNIQGKTTSRVACYHCPWTENTVRQQRAGMHSYTLDCTYGRKMLRVSCNQRIWASHTVE